MDAPLKSYLKAVVLEIRHELEGLLDAKGEWHQGDLERRLASIGINRERSVPADELRLTPEDHEARKVVDAFLQSRAEAGVNRAEAITEFISQSAYTWANRLIALRCMEARELIDEVILQKEVYGRRSLKHHRLVNKEPARCAGDDEGLFAVLFDEFASQAKQLPIVFDPKAPQVALRPSVPSIRRCVALLSGTEAPKGQMPASDEVFKGPDALGWAYQYWNTEEKGRIFESIRTVKGAKIEGGDIIAATCIYTEDYIVKFLVQNSLGALWIGAHPASNLCDKWPYYVRNAERVRTPAKSVAEIAIIDPAVGSGHFLIEAFDLLFDMYREAGQIIGDHDICASILQNNLYGIDIDERAIQITALALLMKAWERAPDFTPRRVNLVATNIRLPKGQKHLELFLKKHPEDAALRPALEAIFSSLENVGEIGSLLQLDEPIERKLAELHEKYGAQMQLGGGDGGGNQAEWRGGVTGRLREHLTTETAREDLSERFFGEAGEKGLSLLELLSRRYDVVAANPPYMGSKNMGPVLKKHVARYFSAGKSDLYAAFILKCLKLAAPGTGRVAMVTQQSWMFLRSFVDLRLLDDEKRQKMPRAFGGILHDTTIEMLAHLGPRAFTEISGEVVNTACFVLAARVPASDHRLTAFRLVGPKSPEEKNALLLSAIDALNRDAATEGRVAAAAAD